MRKLYTWTAALAALSLVSALDAGASPVAFGDTHRYWAGYQNGTGDDTRDTIGTPDLQGGVAELGASGLLTSIRFDYTGRFTLTASGNGRVIPGDLFLDAGSDGDWDYVVKLVSGAHTPVASYASLSVLDVSGESAAYLMSGSDNTGYWRGWGIRDRHPYAWDGGGSAIGTASLAPFDPSAPGGSLFFSLGAGLDVGPRVTIAFAPNCANDVLREEISAPVPEPTAALVFGVGLFVAARARRRA